MSGEVYQLRTALEDLTRGGAPGPRIQAVLDAAQRVVDAPLSVEITRDQLDAWAGRRLYDEEVDEIDEAIPNTSIPDAIAEIASNLPSKDTRVDSAACAEEGRHVLTTRHPAQDCPYEEGS